MTRHKLGVLGLRPEMIWLFCLATLAYPNFALSRDQHKVGRGVDWSDSPEVVIRASIVGPAMWKLTQGSATVWVLPVLSRTPEYLDWDSSRFRRKLKTAKAVIVQTENGGTFPMEAMLSVPDKRLNDVVSTTTYSRLVETVQRERLSILRYQKYKPAWAGVIFDSDVKKRAGFAQSYPAKYITSQSHYAGIPIIAVPRHTVEQIYVGFSNLDERSSDYCLNEYLDEIDGVPALKRAANAWAHGDVGAIKLAFSEDPWVSCLDEKEKFRTAYDEDAIVPIVREISTALQSPATSVAIVKFSDFLRKDGILDRLRSAGVEITSPSE